MVIYFYSRDYYRIGSKGSLFVTLEQEFHMVPYCLNGNNLCLKIEIDLHRIYEIECYLYFLDKVEESKCMKEC